MATVADEITTRLAGDGSLAAILTGGIHVRPISRNDAPTAFSATPPFEIKSTAVVRGRDENSTGIGPEGSFFGFPQIYVYAPDSDVGRQAINDAWERMYGLLHGWRVSTDNDTGVEVGVVGRSHPIEEQDIPDTIVGVMRVQAAGLWRITS